MPNLDDVSADHSSKAKSCIFLALGPVLLVFAIAAIYVYNNRPPNIQVPSPKMPADNGYDYFVKAANMVVGTGPLSDSSKQPSDWTVPELAKFANDNKAGLIVLREGLTKQYLYPPSRSFATMFPELAKFREEARTLVGESMYYEAIGDYNSAFDIRLDCIEFGATVPRGGVLITALVGVAVESIGASDISGLIPRLSPDELAAAAKRLERIQRKRVPCADVIEQEAYCMTAGMIEAMRSRSAANPIVMLRGGPFGLPYGSSGDIFSGVRYAFANKTRMLQETLDYHLALAEEQRRKPYGVPSSVPRPNNYLVQTLMPVFDRARGAIEKSNALTTLIQTDVAVRRYRSAHGSYPQTLAAVVPAYLKKVPIDPLGKGKPLNYRPLKGGQSFLLYSLGPNLTDEGGTPGPSQKGYQTGDIVAGKL